MRRLDHFGLIARYYDRIFDEADPARLRELLALSGGRLLDVGGGTGRVTAALAGQAGLVVVTDASRGMLTVASAKPGLAATRGYAERLPFPDGIFDRVVVVDAFHHFANQKQAAGELMRVLAPGGRLAVEEMNYDRLPAKLIALGEKLLLMGSHFYRSEALRRLFEAPGTRVTVHVDDVMSVWVVVERSKG